MAVNVFGTIEKGRAPIRRDLVLHRSIITILLHIVNNLAIPVGFAKSYSVFAGVQDALVQWWYGHNAVGFLLTTPFLGLYYFIPRQWITRYSTDFPPP